MATDSFGGRDLDRTVIMPTPGGRQPPHRGTAPRASAPPGGTRTGVQASAALPEATGLNPLLAAANPLLNTVRELRLTPAHPDPLGLRDALVIAIRTFESRASAAGINAEKTAAARYVLCTVLDEAVGSTPWGVSSGWSQQTLLVRFHNEAYGGEKVFQLLAKIARKPHANLDLLELIYVCLALGFEGRFRGDRAQLDTWREKLAQLLGKTRGDYERDLSPHWVGTPARRSRILSVLPLWLVLALSGAILLATYLLFSQRLNRQSDPVFAQIHSIRAQVLPDRPAAPAVAASPRLARFLAPEIEQGLVAVRDTPTNSVVTIRGDGLFPSGGTTISRAYEPLLARIATALTEVPGQVTVTVHSDNQPITSARFPSNWHLSQERAKSVLFLLVEQGVPSRRLRYDGRGDAEPTAPNDTAQNRSRNRRVEITLAVPPVGSE